MAESDKQRATPLIFNDEPVPQNEIAYFQFQPYADTLARLIAAKTTRTPLTIGVFGEWGTGKTTLLQSIRDRLDETKRLGKDTPLSFINSDEHSKFRHCRTVWFNAWKYGHEKEILVALVESILRQMRDDGFIQEMYATMADPTRPHLRVAEAALSVLSQMLSLGQIEVDLSKFQVESQFRENLPFLDEFQRVFDQLLLWYLRRKVDGRPNLAEATPGERLKLDQEGVLAIFIDDLDRCLPGKTVQVLEAIKLMVGRPGTVFVLGASERVVQEAIRLHYQEHEKASGADHQQYLEKLIQVRFELPPIRPTDVEQFVEGLHQGRGLDETLRENLPLIAVGVPTNPRRIKTFINYVELEWALLYNSGQAQNLDRAAMTRWLVLDAAERSFTDFVRQLPLRERPEFVQNARKLACGETIETPAQYERWPKERFPRLWAVLKQPRFTFDVTPEMLDLLIHLSAPPVEAKPEEKETHAPPEPLRVPRDHESKMMRPESLERVMPAFVEIPAGAFLMGSQDKNQQAGDSEKPQRKVMLDYAYRIGRYPVTNAEFARFVAAKGYANQVYWTQAGWDWKKDRAEPERYGGDFDLPDHPVVGISWYEAVAYCNWLTETLRANGELAPDQIIRLPTEAEWEKAARGEHGREYPWGDEFDSAKANTAESKIQHTTAVGQFSPAGDSPYGCADMAGNVWEWCGTKWVVDYKIYDADSKHREDLEGKFPRVLRGGAFSFESNCVRAAFRRGDGPDFGGRFRGFRVVAGVS
ncbi:MAG: SUMF1/EgtB/PvdO family nonheme iron enzyme [Chloroflexi bacterium]|nr:SUMF1/EgtB/PvdO family nonheme iron enzyme [Chloroflexota bacterium]